MAERRCVTAAMTASVANPVRRNPPRNSNASAPSGVTMCRFQHSSAEDDEADDGDAVEHRPAVRIGPRMTATGRHTMANAAPSSRPVARVGVDRYSVSVLLMQRPATCQ